MAITLSAMRRGSEQVAQGIAATGSNRINPTPPSVDLAALSGLNEFPGSIPAGKTVIVPLPGNEFYLVSADATVKIRAIGGGNQSFVSYTEGQGAHVNNGFNSLEVSNPTATAINFLIVAGYDTFLDRRLILLTTVTVENKETAMVGSNLVTIAAGGFATFTGITVGLGSRKQITVCNNEDPITNPTGNLTLYDDANRVAGTIKPGDVQTYELTGTLTVKNNTAGAIACNVNEIYYTEV